MLLSSKNAMKLQKIWLWCFKNNYFISAAQIPGKHNIEADKFSTNFKNNNEGQLNPKIFIQISNKFGYPQIDLPRINTQLQIYVSWSCEPETKELDAFLAD